MYIAKVPNRGSPPAILLRESYREGGKVKSRTLANLSHLPAAQIESLRRALRGEVLVSAEEAFEVVRSTPQGHVAAVLGTVRKLGLETALAGRRSRERDLCVAMIVARVVDPCSKLATARGLGGESWLARLGEILELEGAEAEHLYEAMDWLLGRQGAVEEKLARRHLEEGQLVFYDVTSTYFEGRCCPLAKLGHSRDGRKDRPQIVFGLLCNGEGCPVAVEVFEGNVGDPKTLASQIQKVRERFGLKRVVWVGDRGMITDARIREDLRPTEGVEWITALRAPAIRKLVEEGVLQPSLFDERDLAEIVSPAYPGERLIVCRNPFLAEERARKREDLLRATERELEKVAKATRRAKRPLRGKEKIGLRVGKVLGRFKVGKHFRLEIADDGFQYERDEGSISKEAALDGLYVVRTSLVAKDLGAEDAVRAYKRLSQTERAFRSLKTVDLKVRPIYHRMEERVRAHVFLCMLAYYVEWHMRQALAPILFDDDEKEIAEAMRKSVVAPARRSPRAALKAGERKSEDGLPVHSFQTLLKDLATVTRNRMRSRGAPDVTFDLVATPTPLQERAFELLGVNHRM
jgi:transposase